MSGVFRPEQNPTINATDDPELAKAHGLTRFDKASGQYVAPVPPSAGERDGESVVPVAEAPSIGKVKATARGTTTKADGSGDAAAG